MNAFIEVYSISSYPNSGIISAKLGKPSARYIQAVSLFIVQAHK